MAGSTVTLERAQVGDIESEISLNGTIDTDKTIHYTAPATMEIAEAVPASSFVKKGDVILKFDEKSMQRL